MWQWRLYGNPDKVLTDGRHVRILHPGQLNTGAGPDFFNARVDIDGTAWAGNVELHIKASDWHRHGHDKDAAYDSVILHVVGLSDTYVSRQDGSYIPQLELTFNKDTAALYNTLAQGAAPIRCASWIRSVPAIYLHDWIERAGIERLQNKSDRLREYADHAQSDWNQGLFIALARALGFGLNSEPYERLARMLPLRIVGHHADSIFQLEALLLGMAGLLTAEPFAINLANDAYYTSLRSEFQFLAHKYSLTPLPVSIWKMAGLRPGNLPYRKLALLARFLQKGTTLFSSIIEAAGDIKTLSALFECDLNGYWEYHFTFGSPTARSYRKGISEDMIRVLLVNVAAPLYHAYGVYSGQMRFEELAVDLLRKLPPERNSVIRMWADVAAFEPTNAFESQALLHIKREYCEHSECLRCRLGHKLLKVSASGQL